MDKTIDLGNSIYLTGCESYEHREQIEVLAILASVMKKGKMKVLKELTTKNLDPAIF